MNTWIDEIQKTMEGMRGTDKKQWRPYLLIVYALLAIADELRRGRQNDREP